MIDNYAICDNCWYDNWPTQVPHRMADEYRVWESCVICGRATMHGIYRRMNLPDEFTRDDVIDSFP